MADGARVVSGRLNRAGDGFRKEPCLERPVRLFDAHFEGFSRHADGVNKRKGRIGGV